MTEEEIAKEDTTAEITPAVLDETEALLRKEEEELIEELKLTQQKHKDVILSYENVVENIKSLCKLENKREENNVNNVSTSNYLNLNESKFDQSNLHNQVSEEELYRYYAEFLENTKRAFDDNFLNKTEEEFIARMREKGYTAHQPNKSGERSSKTKNSSNMDKEYSSKAKDSTPNYKEDGDFNYRDDDLKKEDEVFKMERDQMIKEFKEAVIIYK